MLAIVVLGGMGSQLGVALAALWARQDHRGRSASMVLLGVSVLIAAALAFGGDDWKTLYFTSRTHLGAVNLKIAGIPVPVPKKV